MEEKKDYVIPEIDIIRLSADPMIDSNLEGPFITNVPSNN